LKKTKSVTLTITHQCNLDCIYCYEKNKNNERMSFDTAKKIIDAEMNKNDGTDKVQIDFFGGEPFIAFELFKKVYDYLKKNNWKKDWKCLITTNGTLLTDERKQWLIHEKEKVTCGLSLDGTKEIHDYNRSNSYDKIDLDFFKKVYPNQPVKMTVSPEKLDKLAEGIIDIHEKGFLVTANLAEGVDWINTRNLEILNRELKKLIDYYLTHPECEVCSMLKMGVEFLQSGDLEVIPKYCGSGTHMFTYDTDGKCYPCQFFMPLSVGKKRALQSKDVDFPENIKVEKLDEKCQQCCIKAMCPTCLGINYFNTNNFFQKNEAYCNLIKIQFRATAYLKYLQWKRGMYQLSDTQEYYLLSGIKLIQEELF